MAANPGAKAYKRRRYATDPEYRDRLASDARRLYRKNIEKYRALARSRNIKAYENLKIAVVNVLTDGEGTCRWCGQGDLDVLTIDHIGNDGAKHRREGVSCGRYLYNWLVRNDYPPGFQVLCFNCNVKKEVLRRRSNRK